MSLTLLRAADRAAVLWKNGGGLTREVAAGPPGAGLDDFDWRISLAEVREPGPFSRFDGIERGFAVLDGRLRLAVDGQAPVTLIPGDPLHVFPGEAGCFAIPLDGPTYDLNIMTRRGRARAHAVRMVVESRASLAMTTDLVVLVATQGVLATTAQGKTVELVKCDAMLASDMMSQSIDLEATSPSALLIISLTVGAHGEPGEPGRIQ